MHKLAARATALTRQIYSSLPWGYRVACFLVRLADAAEESWGRFFYAEFIKADVTDMPDIKGESAELWKDKLKALGNRAADRLPRGYGKEFSVRMYKIALRRWSDPELVQNGIHTYIAKLLTKSLKPTPGTSLKVAENWVIKGVLNQIQDLARSQKKRRQEIGAPMPTDSEGVELDVKDPSSFGNLDDLLSSWQLKRMMEDLRKVDTNNPDRGPSYVKALIEGLSDKEVAAEWNVSPPTVFNWKKDKLPLIEKIVHKHLADAA